MGVIKDGSIAGVLPSNKVFAINYPGYPSSIERALETLGGTQGIAKARESASTKLELHFRPEDPYSHPVIGDDVMPCKRYLLRISKPKAERQISEEAEEKIRADIVGHVSEAYNFNGMADYQHVLAVHADVARKKKRNWADVEPQFEKHGLIDADQEDLMILLPPFFSQKNTQEDVVLKPSMYASQKKRQEGIIQQRWEMDIEPSLAIEFNIKDVPKKVNWEKFIPEGTEERICQVAVCDLFNERPVWVRQSLSEHLSKKGLNLGSNTIKRYLFRAAYYFANGPYRRFWIRKGYDPRKDPESRMYQRIDFRVPPPLRSYCDSGIASGLEHKWEDLCSFKVFPYKCQTSFQLVELVDDYIQQEIRKPLTQTSCTFATGWFPPHIHEILRCCVAVRFLSVYPDTGAESFLKLNSLRLGKAKRTMNVIKEKAVNRDEVDVEEKEMSNEDFEDDDMEDDVEDENVDDDFDAYEGLDVGGDGSDLLPESAYINQENVSKIYLQELFGSFPKHGGSTNAENSDGEYHIFDESNSEDDDEY